MTKVPWHDDIIDAKRRHSGTQGQHSGVRTAVTQASAEHDTALRFNRFEYLPSVASRNALTLPLPLLSTHDT